MTCNLNTKKIRLLMQMKASNILFLYMLSYFECISIIYTILSDNLKMHYFRDNYAFLRIDFRLYYSHINLRLSLGFNIK